ncbi:MAG: NAD(P)/FAD-dependent oxidoreductase [Lachnospiraceae bacterium]
MSYCATCDGMLYRGKKVAVIGLSADAPEEAEFLRSIGCEVEYFDAARAKKYEIRGSQRVEALIADGTEYAVECVFILRAGVAPGSLVPGLELEGPHIKVNADMATSVPGVFAAGDCVGAPYQVGKAVGEGNIAGISAAKYVENTHEEE